MLRVPTKAGEDWRVSSSTDGIAELGTKRKPPLMNGLKCHTEVMGLLCLLRMVQMERERALTGNSGPGRVEHPKMSNSNGSHNNSNSYNPIQC